MFRLKGFHLLISILIIFGMFIPPNPASAEEWVGEDIAGGSEDEVEVTLRADRAPLPGENVRLTIHVNPFIDAPELEIHWYIPEGVLLVGDETDSYLQAAANQSIDSERTLNFPSEGTFKIIVSATLNFSQEMTYGASGVLFFIIDSQGSRVTDQDPAAHRPERHDPDNQVDVTVSPASETQAEPDEDPCFTIFVHADRIERPVTYDGYGAEYRIPLAGIGIEVRESDLLFDDSYGSLSTDANGNMAAAFCDDDGLWDDTLEIYLRITAQRGDPIVYVEDSSWIDEIYEYDTGEVESDGGVLNFDIHLGPDWSGIFNIIDAAWQARQLWVDSGGSYSEETEIHWEPGYGDAKSYYIDYYNEITIADDPSDPDQWDESVIMHEWTHSADDYYSCDDNPGGDHSWSEVVDSELAWGEGYPDYYQGAVRSTYGYPDANYYLNMDGSGINGSKRDLELCWEWQCPVTTDNEGAIAATLWDLFDDGPDYLDQDQVSYGHAAIQAVYTSDAFKDVAYGLFDDTCNFDTFMRGWVDYGMPADAPTAAVVQVHTGYSLAPAKQSAQRNNNGIAGDEYSAADVFRWWKQLTYVADNSLSMNGPKFDAMKSLFVEAVNDLGDDPEGTEFNLELFNNSTSTNDIAFSGQFYPERLIDPINGLATISYSDNICEVNALRALAQAVDDKEKGDVWLFTDGDTSQNPSVESIRQLLTDNKLRASMALMGICTKNSDISQPGEPVSIDMLQQLPMEEQQSLMAERLLAGKVRADLGLMADDVPGGIVPYLLTALTSGGQFLYVDESQVEDAADILRAQITNSAGAGRWSDYVSDQPTYRYDRLASWEYDWIDARLYGTNQGNPDPNAMLDIAIPGYFQYFSGPYYNKVHVFEDGYVTLGLHEAYVYNNTPLPNPAEPNNALYPFWDNIRPYCPPGSEGTPAACEGFIYTYQQGDWFAIEFYHYEAAYGSFPINTFEILLNLDTYEIRYQYQTVPNGAESATIGLENSSGTTGFQVSYNDVNGADDGTGYKFTPAPPQPTKTYTVTVDSTMDSVGFLLTGYSGTFEPLAVTDPNGNLVICTDPGTLCLDLDLVQYVQVNTNGRSGDWHAMVDAGSSGSGTFSFTSFAASPITVEGQTNHTLATGTQRIQVRIAGEVDNCQATGVFHRLDGSPIGYDFNLYDDGAHNDMAACDGLFGSAAFYLGASSAYLTVRGVHNGEAFTRIDPVPYTFQPFTMVSLGDGANFGGVTQLQYQLTNTDVNDHCYWITYGAPEGWWIEFPLLPLVCVDAGQTEIDTFDVYMTPGYSNNLPSGTSGVITISASEWEKGAISDSASARITRNRLPYKIAIFSPTPYMRPNGDEVTLQFLVTDIQGAVVADGTPVYLFATNGTVSPETAITNGGYFVATFTSGPNIGTAIVAGLTDNSVTASAEIEIINPLPNKIKLSMSTNQLPADGVSSALLIATVQDEWGNPVANQVVQIGVESDDGQMGTVDGGEVTSGITDANGQFTTTFTNAGVVGKVGIRAELIYNDGSGDRVVHHDRKVMYIGIQFTLLPLMRR